MSDIKRTSVCYTRPARDIRLITMSLTLAYVPYLHMLVGRVAEKWPRSLRHDRSLVTMVTIILMVLVLHL
jgi:hypothetical protein